MKWYAITLALIAYIAMPERTTAQNEGVLTIESITFGTGIEDREPTGTGTTFDSRPETIYCHTRILGAKTPTYVYHVWLYNGEEKSRMRLEVGSASWRTWSSRSTDTLLMQGEGIWEVEVRSADEEVLGRATFTIRRTNG